MKFKGIFVTGTDTGVGKTTVSCGIVAALARRGLSVGVFKPVETGCPTDASGRRTPEDARQLTYFSNCRLGLETVCPYALREPLAPSVAAMREGIRLDVGTLTRHYEGIAATHDVTLTEGAGGLLVPITPTATYAELAAALPANVVVVVGSRLGAINHALLTMRYATSAGLHVLGYVINFLTPEPDVAAQTNVAVLADWLGPPLGVVPYLGAVNLTPADRGRLAEMIAGHVRIDELLIPC